MKMIKPIYRAILLCLLTFVASAATERPFLVDRIIAVVGEDLVTLSELRIEATKLTQRLRQKGGSSMPSTAAIQKKAFDTLVMNKLQLAEAAKIGIEVEEETISRAVSSIAANNQMSVPELRAALEAEGLDFQTFRRSMRDEIIVRRLRNREVTNKIQVTKSEIDSYLERSGGADGRIAVHLLHMVVATADGAGSAQREKARLLAAKIVERLRAGESFGTLAQQPSGEETLLKAGDLGWLDVKDVPPLLQPYVAKMQRGDTEGPIAAGRGFHIIQLEAVRGGQSKIVRQTHARHILIRTNEVTSDTDAQQRLANLRDRVIDGDDFDTLARSHSDDQTSAIKGGDLGWSTPGNLVSAFEEQMDQLAVNEISQPFKTQFGWHIVQTLGRRDYDATDETLRDQARKSVRDEKAKEALENYLRRLRDEAYIELRLDDINS